MERSSCVGIAGDPFPAVSRDEFAERLRSEFVTRCEAAVAQAYPALADGTVLLRFPRLFFIATRLLD